MTHTHSHVVEERGKANMAICQKLSVGEGVDILSFQFFSMLEIFQNRRLKKITLY